MPDYRFDMFGPDREHYGPQGSQVTYYTGGLGVIVVIISAIFAAVIIVALLRSAWAASTAIIVGGFYFGAITLAALMVLSGTLAQIVTVRQEQQTLRAYHVLTIERTALPTADPLQTLSAPSLPPLGGSTYVPAEDLTIRRDAALWAVSLYGPDGLPDGNKVHLTSQRERPGRLRVGAPGAAQRAWLIHMKVLEEITHGVRLRIERYPDAATLRDILNG